MLNPNSDHTQLNYLPQPALDRIAQMNLFDTNCAGHQLLEHIANKWKMDGTDSVGADARQKAIQRTEAADRWGIAQDANPESSELGAMWID